MKDYGLINGVQELGAYIFGRSIMPRIPYQEDGDWTPYLPTFEHQAPKFETSGCTVFGLLNQIEIFEKAVYGEESNYAERFTYLLSGITPGKGVDPQIPYEAVRKNGLIPQKYLPLASTKEIMVDRSHLTQSILLRGQNWLAQNEFMHEWLWEADYRPVNWIDVLREALKTSPIGVSVSAWNEADGVYVSRGNVNNHFVVLVKVDADGYLYVYDSYEPRIKKLSKDHNIRRAKRIWLNRRTMAGAQTQISIISRILKMLMGKKKTLVDIVRENLGTDVSPDDLAKDEVGCAESVTNLLKKLWPETPIITGTYTLYEYLSKPTSNYVRTTVPIPGTIIVSPTGTGNGSMPGHTGIYLENGVIASNDSASGKFLTNYTTEAWLKRYAGKGGFKAYLFNHV